jgi:hypothetical protein
LSAADGYQRHSLLLADRRWPKVGKTRDLWRNMA